jgi:hypothetical protein
MGDAPEEVNEIDYDNPPFPLTAIDRELLAMKDEDFHRITWDDLKDIIGIRSPNHCANKHLMYSTRKQPARGAEASAF